MKRKLLFLLAVVAAGAGAALEAAPVPNAAVRQRLWEKLQPSEEAGPSTP